MPMLEEHPAALIRATTTNFSIAPDKASLSRIQTSHAHLSQTRTSQLTQLHASLKRLSRSLHTLQTTRALQLEKAHHDDGDDNNNNNNNGNGDGEHAARILALDTRKFRVAKECGDLEADGERVEGEVGVAERDVAGLEEEGVERGREAERESAAREAEVLRLKIYRSLGVDVERDAGGRVCRAVVRNVQRGDVDVIEVVDGSEARCVERIWEAL